MINFWGSPLRSRKARASKFYGVHAQGWVTPVKAKSDTYVCIVGVCGVLSRQYDMLRLAAVKMSIKTRSVGGLGIINLSINVGGRPPAQNFVRPTLWCACSKTGHAVEGKIFHLCIVVVDGV